MPWISAGATIGSSVIGGLMGGSKAGERAAKDAAANAKYIQEAQAKQAQANLSPYVESGQEANRLLSRLLGTDTSGYGVSKPVLQDFLDKERNDHFQKYGKDYGRQANTVGAGLTAKANYERALKEWESGLDAYKKQNAGNGTMGSGQLLKEFTYNDFKGNNKDIKSFNDLLKDFSNEDFVKDPGYTFRMMEGEKGINRAQLARGGFDSGAALKELNRYNQDFASNEFGNAYNRDAANKSRTLGEFNNAYTRNAADKSRTFGFLSNTANTGLSAAGGQVASGQNAANQTSNIQLGLGNQLNQIQQNNADNQSNLIQNTISNLVYGYERNKASNPYKTPDFNPNAYTGGSSSIPQTKFYL